MIFNNTSTDIHQIVNKALDFFLPTQANATIEDTAEVMYHLQEHFADPIYGLRSGYIISSQYHGQDQLRN